MNSVNVAYSIPIECLELVEALITRLGGCVISNECLDAEVITVPPMPENERPARMLKGLRLREGMTQRELAKALNVPQRHISEYEKGKRPIPPDKAEALAEILHSVKDNFLMHIHT